MRLMDLLLSQKFPIPMHAMVAIIIGGLQLFLKKGTSLLILENNKEGLTTGIWFKKKKSVH